MVEIPPDELAQIDQKTAQAARTLAFLAKRYREHAKESGETRALMLITGLITNVPHFERHHLACLLAFAVTKLADEDKPGGAR